MKKNIVFMTAVKVPGKESRAAPYKYGIDSFKKWCDKRNHRLVVLEDPIFDASIMKPNFYRYFCFDLLENQGIEYDKILLTDADAINTRIVQTFLNYPMKNYQLLILMAVMTGL